MKKTTFAIAITTVLAALMCVCALSGCKNFMQLAGFKDTIQTEVDVANAEKLTVHMQVASSSMGNVSPVGSTIVKQNVGFSVIYTANSDYAFNHWAAFSSEYLDTLSTTALKSIVYDSTSGSDWNNTYSTHELGSSVVSFDNAQSAETKAYVHSLRTDIIILPVCAARPAVNFILPKDNVTDIVINSTIQIVFSKKIESSYLITEKTLSDDNDNDGMVVLSNGTCDYARSVNTKYLSVNIRTGSFEKPVYSDISSRFVPSLSASGQTLTLTLKKKTQVTYYTLPANSPIDVIIDSGLTDSDGNTMAGDYNSEFQTGTGSDDVVPTISVLKGEYYKSSWSFESDAYSIMSGKTSADALTAYKANRCNKYVNLYAFATDKTKSTDTASEGGVSTLSYTATVLLLSATDAAPATDATGIKASGTVGYSSGSTNINSASPLYGESFDDILPSGCSGGAVFSADLSGLRDGLIRIDVYATDSSGQSSSSSALSLFVVKDTEAPVLKAGASDQTSSIKISNTSSTWVNKTGLSLLSLATTTGFTDSGTHSDYYADSKTISWACRASSDSIWSIGVNRLH